MLTKDDDSMSLTVFDNSNLSFIILLTNTVYTPGNQADGTGIVIARISNPQIVTPKIIAAIFHPLNLSLIFKS
jgi:hypothetical protein